MLKSIRFLLFVAFLFVACLCFSQKPSKTKPSTTKPSPAKSSEIDVEHSTITVHVLRAGVFGFTGDNHEVQAPIARGKLDEAAKTIEFEIETAKMQVLDPKMEPAKRAQVQEKMLGPEVLNTAQYPLIQFTSTSVASGRIGQWSVTGNLKLHGQTHPVVVQVSQPADEAALANSRTKGHHYRGTATLKQTDFGIKPVSVAGGTVKVKDELKLDFEIVTR
ncbi:MAG TPA: YceI family protein [Terriglobales bacterium]|jgi:polyisoprenoid-binding protein YceI|nr:YceI family protein [Terriglobales bacterium]